MIIISMAPFLIQLILCGRKSKRSNDSSSTDNSSDSEIDFKRRKLETGSHYNEQTWASDDLKNLLCYFAYEMEELNKKNIDISSEKAIELLDVLAHMKFLLPSVSDQRAFDEAFSKYRYEICVYIVALHLNIYDLQGYEAILEQSYKADDTSPSFDIHDEFRLGKNDSAIAVLYLPQRKLYQFKDLKLSKKLRYDLYLPNWIIDENAFFSTCALQDRIYFNYLCYLIRMMHSKNSTKDRKFEKVMEENRHIFEQKSLSNEQKDIVVSKAAIVHLVVSIITNMKPETAVYDLNKLLLCSKRSRKVAADVYIAYTFKTISSMF